MMYVRNMVEQLKTGQCKSQAQVWKMDVEHIFAYYAKQFWQVAFIFSAVVVSAGVKPRAPGALFPSSNSHLEIQKLMVNCSLLLSAAMDFTACWPSHKDIH